MEAFISKHRLKLDKMLFAFNDSGKCFFDLGKALNSFSWDFFWHKLFSVFLHEGPRQSYQIILAAFLDVFMVGSAGQPFSQTAVSAFFTTHRVHT